MKSAGSALYEGVTTHLRLVPRRHFLKYRQMMLLIDLEAAPRLDAELKLFSFNRFNLFSFHEKDHGFGEGPRAFAQACLDKIGLALSEPRLSVLAMPRVLGFVFNPISIWFIREGDGPLRAVIYEVNNTFGQRHAYEVRTPEGEEPPLRHTAQKAFHVSPFLPMDLDYHFSLTPPGDQAGLSISVARGDQPVLNATFIGERLALTDPNLLRLFLRLPFTTLGVVAGIHFEALKLIAKGVRLKPDPKLADHRITG